jgi:hypothetical protein
MIRTPSKPKKPALLSAGNHSVNILSITETDSTLTIKFGNSKGYFNLNLDITPDSVKILSKLSYLCRVSTGQKVNIRALIGCKVLINVSNNQLIRIK